MASQAASTSTEAMQVTQAATGFAWKLFKQVAESKANILFSPLSITVSMAMTLAGARNKTAEQMKEALNFVDILDENIHLGFKEIQAKVAEAGKDDVKLHMANRLYGQKNFEILSDFLTTLQKEYAAEFGQVDFGASEATRQEINQWVEGKTMQKIKELIPSGVLTALTRLVLVNAVYFKGNWASKFDKRGTQVHNFYVSDSETIKVDMMYQEQKFKVGYNANMQLMLLELPYVGKNLAMYILLPNDKRPLSEIESKLEAEHLVDLEKSFSPREMKTQVLLPRFTLEDSFSLKDTLTALGMVDLFVDTKADLKGIHSTEDLYVSAVLHKAFMEVNEEGTEAAAATAVVMQTRSLPMVHQFTCDRPFLFFIQEKTSRSILFLGRMVRPPAASDSSKDEL